MKAIEHLNSAIEVKDITVRYKLFPHHLASYSALYCNRGLLYEKQDKYEAALQDFKKAIEFNPVDPDLYFYRGNLHLVQGEYQQAFDDYSQAIALDPANPEYERRKALGYAIVGALDKVQEHINAAEKKSNQLKKVQNELGLQAFSKGCYSNAIEHFNQFIESASSRPEGYQNRGIALFEAGDIKQALNDFDEAIAINPASADLYQLRAIALMTLSVENELEEDANLKEALSSLLKALELRPGDPKIYQNIAALHNLEGNLDIALTYYDKALTLVPSNEKLSIQKNVILIHFEKGEYERVLSYCESAMKGECKEGDLCFIQGVSAFETNQFEKAVHYFRTALELGYDENSLFFYRAKAFFSLQRFEKALEDASRVIQGDSFHIECYKLRGLIYLSLRRESEASADFSKILELTSESLSSPKNQVGGSTRFSEEIFHLSSGLITSFDGRLIYTERTSKKSNQGALINKLGEVDFDEFKNGLVSGLFEGGKETLKELGPFLAQLVFHPINTTNELLKAIKFLYSSALNEEWDTVCEALIPELKELFSDWDKIEDYHKGKLTGLFIGKNGIAALTAIGAIKTFSKLKNIVIESSRTGFSHVFKRTKPEIIPLPASELPSFSVPMTRPWQISITEGALVETPFMNESSLIRMAPGAQHNQILLEARAVDNLHRLGHAHLTWEAFESSVANKYSEFLAVEFRGIPSPIIEAEVIQIGSKAGKLEIAFNENGGVSLAKAVKPGKILVRNMNTKIHIMQRKHAWDKLIVLTGNLEEDFKRVVTFLEDKNIMDSKNLKNILELPRDSPIKNINLLEYRTTIGGHEIQVFFEKYLDTGEIFIKNGWVVIK